jgi:hypothetical protein
MAASPLPITAALDQAPVDHVAVTVPIDRHGHATGTTSTTRPATRPTTRPTGAPATKPESRTTLVVVKRRRSWTAVAIGLLSVLIFGGLLAAAVFHTQLAERQLRIDRLERAVTHERERFDNLRHRRAELRSPAYLATVAGDLTMIRGKTGTFLRVSPEQLALQIAAAGAVDGGATDFVADVDPLDQFRDVKAVSEGQP